MHLVLRDGAPCAPVALPHDAEGAAALADLYAYGPGTTVRAMMNATIDGAIAGADGTSGSLSNPDDSFVFGVLRALADAVLVGASTVRTEDYRRPAGRGDLRDPSRRPGGADRPVLAIMTSSGQVPASIEPDWPTLLIAPRDAVSAVTARSGWPADRVIGADSPAEVVAALVARGHRGIQIEGGPSSLGRFAAAGLLDELCLSTTHRTVGGPSPRAVDGPLHDDRWELRSLLIGEHAHAARYRRLPDDLS